MPNSVSINGYPGTIRSLLFGITPKIMDFGMLFLKIFPTKREKKYNR